MMDDGEDYIFRPILRGLCKYESALDGSLSLYDFSKMNDALDVEDENKSRAYDASRQQH